jgi:serine/threonine protein kinase
MHGDVKAMNVLLGHGYQPYLADFGLARIVVAENDDNTNSKPLQRHHYLAGSYGYMAPGTYSFSVLLKLNLSMFYCLTCETVRKSL